MADTNLETTQTTETKFTHTQVDIDNAVKDRLGRERKSFATKLGIDTYSDDSISKYIDDNNASKNVRDTLQTENTTLTNTLNTNNQTIDMLKASIIPDQLDNARALANVQIQKDSELDFNAGLLKAIEAAPFLVSQTQSTNQEPQKPVKIGVEVDNKVDNRTEQQRYMEKKYGKSKYYNN